MLSSFCIRPQTYFVTWERPRAEEQSHSWAILNQRIFCWMAGSWDCTVKLWSLAEGRQPWTGLGCLKGADRDLSEHDSAVTHLDADLCGNMLLTGTEEGVLTLWDVRQDSCVWQVSCPACDSHCKGRRGFGNWTARTRDSSVASVRYVCSIAHCQWLILLSFCHAQAAFRLCAFQQQPRAVQVVHDSVSVSTEQMSQHSSVQFCRLVRSAQNAQRSVCLAYLLP